MTISTLSMREKSLVFIGFMGVGKTTVARLVAKKLYRDFIDIDEEIEKEYKMPTTEIFKKFSEEKFREAEKEHVFHYSVQPLKVIALGGGAFLREDVRKVCLENNIVFYLDISWNSWKDRLHMLVDSRPILQNQSIEDIEKLFHERRNIYQEHNSSLLTDHVSEEEVANYIIDSLK